MKLDRGPTCVHSYMLSLKLSYINFNLPEDSDEQVPVDSVKIFSTNNIVNHLTKYALGTYFINF